MIPTKVSCWKCAAVVTCSRESLSSASAITTSNLILGGVLTFESDGSPPLGQSLDARLRDGAGDDRLDLACVVAHGTFSLNGQTGGYCYDQGGKPATAFLFNLIPRLQFSGTVPMIDVQAYGRWLGA